MKILSICPYLPSENTGHAGAQLIYRNLSFLSKYHSITIACFVNNDERKYQDNLDKLGMSVYTVSFERNESSIFQYLSFHKIIIAIKSFFSLQPFFLSKYKNKEMVQLVQSIGKANTFDIVHIEYNIMHHYAKLFPNTPIVLTEHDVTTHFKERLYLESSSRLTKTLRYLDYLNWNRLEPRIIRKFNVVTCLTNIDKNYAEKWARIPPIRVVPPAISVKGNLPQNKHKALMTFVGSFNRIPNIQVIEEFINGLFPYFAQHDIQTTIRIAGKHLSDDLQKKLEKFPNVEYAGFVNDIDTFIAESILFIAPIKTGAGFKMKTTHALACGTPVLTTSVGAEGINITSDEGLFVEDNMIQFAKTCEKLIKQPKYLMEIGKIGQNRVRDQYSIESVGKQWDKVYLDISHGYSSMQ